MVAEGAHIFRDMGRDSVLVGYSIDRGGGGGRKSGDTILIHCRTSEEGFPTKKRINAAYKKDFFSVPNEVKTKV